MAHPLNSVTFTPVIQESPPIQVKRSIEEAVKPLSNKELLNVWEEDLSDDTNYRMREEHLTVMQSRDLRPSKTTYEREVETGVYPNIYDPDFATKLYKKMEFAELSSEGVEEDTCDKTREQFDTTPVQRLIARFLHPSTPYRGVLLNHGVGVGKTCTAITVAEMYLDLLPTNKVFIVAPVSIIEGFKKTIFDSTKLSKTSKDEYKLTGAYWKSNQCTGMTYLNLTGTEGESNINTVKEEVSALIKKRYKFFSYGGFATWVTKQADKVIPMHIQGERRENMYKQNILNLFSDHLIIVDEAHNLRDKAQDKMENEAGDEEYKDDDEEAGDEVDMKKAKDAAEGKRLSPILEKIMLYAEGLRVMFMTATPMYNIANDITFLFKLLVLNDTKDESKASEVSKIFDEKGSIKERNEKMLVSLIRRYVSFMRGENPNSFPLRLNPKEIAGKQFVDNYPPRSIRKQEWETGIQFSKTEKAILSELPLVVNPARGLLEEELSSVLRARESGNGPSSFNLDKSIQLCNFVYPDQSYGSDAFGKYFKESSKPVRFGKKYSAKQLEWIYSKKQIENVFKYDDENDSLYVHSPKIANIVQSVSKAEGISFIYSRYLKSGALLVAIALEVNGWCRVMADGTPAPLLKSTKGDFSKMPKFILLTSDQEMSPFFNELLNYATTFSNPSEAEKGTNVKAIIGSQVASEGLDLKCIRELHVLDGWFHLNRLEQIIGRGVRYCSHALLSKEKQNCTIYLHCVSLNEYETPDLFTYRVAVQKAAPIGIVSRLIKINAWDCALNKDAILLKGLGTRTIETSQGRRIKDYKLEDKPYTGMCDFQETCEYACAIQPGAEKGTNESTYKEYDFRRRFMEKFELVVNYFKTEGTYIDLKTLREVTFQDMPWSIVVAWLRKMLGTYRIKQQMDDQPEIYGTLFIKNGYLVFQPEGVSDKMIPQSMRYGRAFGRIPQSMDVSMKLEAQQQEEEDVVSNPIVEEASLDVLFESAMSSLSMWHTILKKYIQHPFGPIEIDAKQHSKMIQGMRFLYSHFGSMEETEGIGCKWWMDYMWTPSERFAVLSTWTKRGFETLEANEKLYAKQFKANDELFEKGGMRGFFILKAKLECYYFHKGEILKTNQTIDNLIAEKIQGPTNIASDTDEVYGFHIMKGENVTFKSVVKAKKEKEEEKEEKKKGVECMGSTNLDNKLAHIRVIQQKLEEYLPASSKFRKLLLNPSSDPETIELTDRLKSEKLMEKRYKAGGDSVQPLAFCRELDKTQLCQYLEFLLRWMDATRVNDKRWFLSLVDVVRKDSTIQETKKTKSVGRPKGTKAAAKDT